MQPNPHCVMPLDLHFELRLEERQSDRVFVSVVLAPAGPSGASVDGVSVQMQDRGGEPLGARLVLPLSGAVVQPLITTVEVRSRGAVPPGARVVGVAWRGPDQLEADCPCDPGTELEVHMRGRKVIGIPKDDGRIRGLDPEEREVLAALMPWLNEPRVVATEPIAVLDSPAPDVDEVVGDVADQFDLSDEDAALLKELLGEE